MCNLSDEIEERGIQKGIAQGIAQGKQEGTIQATLANIRNLMKNLSISAEQAMTILEVSKADHSMYIGLLNDQ